MATDASSWRQPSTTAYGLLRLFFTNSDGRNRIADHCPSTATIAMPSHPSASKGSHPESRLMSDFIDEVFLG